MDGKYHYEFDPEREGNKNTKFADLIIDGGSAIMI
ncbi:MAG: hypothetical protein K0R31_1807 [Clostridiales bacterium]|jgi:hypothetical protein|nr:hypothetical protein [Clostridiales bacterium]